MGVGDQQSHRLGRREPSCQLGGIYGRRVKILYPLVPVGSVERAGVLEKRNTDNDTRLTFINSQLKNRYSRISFSPFVMFLESTSKEDNIGRLHPMTISRQICDNFGDRDVIEMRSIRKKIESVF